MSPVGWQPARRRRYAFCGLSGLVLLACSATSPAATVTLSPIKDNTLYENAQGLLSNGAGDHIFVGRTVQGVGQSIRRAVLAFDIAGHIPPGAVIESAQLSMTMSRTTEAGTVVFVHRTLEDWGEGASHAFGEEGAGIQAMPGDATWLHRFHDAHLWEAPGGRYAATASASRLVVGVGRYTWSATTDLVADVQAWLDEPTGNFGWTLIGIETVPQTVKRFDSRTHPLSDNRPTLVVQYTPRIPTLSALGVATMAILLAAAGVAIHARKHRAHRWRR